jgi:hypothetical protein
MKLLHRKNVGINVTPEYRETVVKHVYSQEVVYLGVRTYSDGHMDVHPYGTERPPTQITLPSAD